MNPTGKRRARFDPARLRRTRLEGLFSTRLECQQAAPRLTGGHYSSTRPVGRGHGRHSVHTSPFSRSPPHNTSASPRVLTRSLHLAISTQPAAPAAAPSSVARDRPQPPPPGSAAEAFLSRPLSGRNLPSRLCRRPSVAEIASCLDSGGAGPRFIEEGGTD